MSGEAISGNDAAVVSSGKVTQSTATTRKERPAPEQKAIDEIRKLNGKIQYADSSSAAPVVKVSFGGVRGADLAMLKDLPDIKELELGGSESTVVDITFIAPLAKLTVLDLPCIAPDQFAILADLPSLETLTVGIAKPPLSSAGIDNPYKNRDATKEFNSQDFLKQAIDRLSKSRSLKNLQLRAQTSPLGRAQATTFSSIDRLPRLTFLDLSHLTLGDDNFAALGRCVNLNTLVLTNWNGKAFTEKGIQQLSGCGNLKRLSIKGASDPILGASASFPSLAHLDCPVSRLSDAQLVSVRRSNTRLTLTERPPHPKWWGDWLADDLKALAPIPAVVPSSGGSSRSTPSDSVTTSGRPNENKPTITRQSQNDLLKGVDFTTQAVDGNASATADGLRVDNRTSGKRWPRVMTTRRLDTGESYTFRCSFTHVKGPCGFVFPVGDHNTFIMLGGWDGSTSGIQMLDGKYGDNNTTTVRNKRIADNGTHRIELDVAQSGDAVKITVTLDDKPFTSYQGSATSLSLHPEVKIPDKQVIGLVAGDEAVFHSATLLVNSTSASLSGISPIVGRWDNVTSKGWVMELLATGEAINIDPKGVVDTRGTWKDEGKGKIVARLGRNGEWEWKATMQGDTMVVEAFLDGKPHSKSSFSRKATTLEPSKNTAVMTVADALALLEGEWQCIAGEENGVKQQERQVQEEKRRLRISGNSLTMERTGATWTGKFEIGTPEKKTFDWIGKNAKGDLTEWIGIYELGGDTLRLCFVFQRDGKATRPTDFNTTAPSAPGLAQAFYTFRRVAK